MQHLAIDLNWWDDFVGVFAPEKVLRRLEREFPDAEIDETDHQKVRLDRELAFWANSDVSVRDGLVRSSWRLYRTNGPTYRFTVPFAPEWQVRGWCRRMTVGFSLPDDLPEEHRERVRRFLLALDLGEPRLRVDHDEPDGPAD